MLIHMWMRSRIWRWPLRLKRGIRQKPDDAARVLERPFGSVHPDGNNGKEKGRGRRSPGLYYSECGYRPAEICFGVYCRTVEKGDDILDIIKRQCRRAVVAVAVAKDQAPPCEWLVGTINLEV